MQGVEISHCNAAIEAILTASYAFWDSTVEGALRPILRYGKSDTLGMDAMPEITIIDMLLDYDKFSAVIAEESGERGKKHPVQTDQRPRTYYITDPTDRSTQIKESLEGVADKTRKVGEVIRDPEYRNTWEEKFGKPVEITGGTSAITCVRRGVPIFSVIVNYITRVLYLSCSAGNYAFDLPEEITPIKFEDVINRGKKIYFHDIRSHAAMRRFVTFMGSGHKVGYRNNFIDSKFMTEEEMKENLHYDQPGGPSRALYLSTLQPADSPIGLVLANGEKITEWVHWMTFVRFARKENDQHEPALRLYEVCQDRPWTKEGILMSTPPAYSIFKPVAENDSRMVINVAQFSSFPNPSQIRSTLIVTPADNQWATRVVNQYGYRPIEFYEE